MEPLTRCGLPLGIVPEPESCADDTIGLGCTPAPIGVAGGFLACVWRELFEGALGVARVVEAPAVAFLVAAIPAADVELGPREDCTAVVIGEPTPPLGLRPVALGGSEVNGGIGPEIAPVAGEYAVGDCMMAPLGLLSCPAAVAYWRLPLCWFDSDTKLMMTLRSLLRRV